MDTDHKKFVLSKTEDQINLEICPEYIRKGMLAFALMRLIFLFVVVCGMSFGGLVFFHQFILKDVKDSYQKQIILEEKCAALKHEAAQLQDAVIEMNNTALARLSRCPAAKIAKRRKNIIKNAVQTGIGGEEE